MKKTDGFTDKQMSQLSDFFVGAFNETLAPLINDLMDRMDGLEKTMGRMEDQFSALKAEVVYLRKDLNDLRDDSVSSATVMNLRRRVEELERRMGVAGN